MWVKWWMNGFFTPSSLALLQLLSLPLPFSPSFPSSSSHPSHPFSFPPSLGECTGLPYTERFPVIPTYGLEELTGWFPSPDPVQEEIQHPLGRHNPHGKHMFPRSVLMHSKDDWIYLTPFISSEIPMPVRNVPLSEVKVLVGKCGKYLLLTLLDSKSLYCGSTWPYTMTQCDST